MSKPKIKIQDSDAFSIMLGGPLYQLYIRTGLVWPALQHCLRRVVFFCVITWLPLFLFALMAGTAFSHANIPFLSDVSTHARFLISLPLLILSELLVHQRLGLIVEQFTERNIIPDEYKERFHTIIKNCMRLRNSVAAEIGLIVVVFLVGHFIWREFSVLNTSTWYTDIDPTSVNAKPQLTYAGYWLLLVSLPIYQFMILRWYFRIGIWYKFLWQVSRIPLQLNSLHPDKAGGIGFLANSAFAFGLFLLAHTVLLSGLIANRIWHAGETLPQFNFEIIGTMLYLMLIVLLPLAFFSGKLLRAKRLGTLAYGVTASRYVDEFRKRWIGDHVQESTKIMGTPDIQSLSDLANSFEVTDQMRLMPFSKGTILLLAVLTALPFIPLLLTMMPIEKMIRNIMKLIF